MRARLQVDSRDPRPLWRQIEEGLEQLVGAGTLGAGAAVPSVRELAQQLQVNPATVAKAFQQLVERGVLESRRGAGTFVVELPPALRAAERRERLVEAATRLASVAATTGAGGTEAHAALDTALGRVALKGEEKR